MQGKIDPEQSLKDIPKSQKIRPAKPISFYKEKYKNRNNAMAEAYRSGHYTLAIVVDEIGVTPFGPPLLVTHHAQAPADFSIRALRKCSSCLAQPRR